MTDQAASGVLTTLVPRVRAMPLSSGPITRARLIAAMLFAVLTVGWGQITLAAPAAATFGTSANAVPTTTFDDVGAALRSDPLYVDAKAEVQLDASQQAEIRSAIGKAGTPMFVAVLPRAALTGASNNPSTVLSKMRNATGESGTYAVLIGTSSSAFGFQAASTLGSVGAAANEAYVSHKTDPTATIVSFVDQVGQQAASGQLETAGSGSSSVSGSSSGSATGLLAVLGLMGIAGGGATWFAMRRKKAKAAQITAEVRKTLDEDITAYGEAMDTVNVDVDDPRLGEDGRAELQAALEQYDVARRASGAMRSPDDAAKVTSALDEGRWRMACVQARLAGEAAPERRAPCFFDPRHGQSVTEVPFAPSGGAARDVPACQACAVAVESGIDPDIRMVTSGAGQQPYYNSGRQYAGYSSGYYSNNMDMFSTIFMATAIGSMFSHSYGYGGYGYGGQDAGASSGGDGGWGGGGDSGGGFFDGGGGGGWGGGGGDFGGGGW